METSLGNVVSVTVKFLYRYFTPNERNTWP